MMQVVDITPAAPVLHDGVAAAVAQDIAPTPIAVRADADAAAQALHDEFFDRDGKPNLRALLERRMHANESDRLDPGGEITLEMIASVPVRYGTDVPNQDRGAKFLSPHATAIETITGHVERITASYRAMDPAARDAAIAAEIPRVRGTLRPTEKVSEIDVKTMAARAVERREVERRQAATRDDVAVLQRERAAIDAAWHRDFQARRDVPVPVPALRPEEQPDTSTSALLGHTEKLMSITILEARKTHALLGDLLAAQLVPAGTAPAALLALVEQHENPYVRSRAEQLFAQAAPQLKSMSLIDPSARAMVGRFLEIRESRVAEPLRRAEAAEYRMLGVLEQQVGRLVSMLPVVAKSAVDRSFFDGPDWTKEHARRQQTQKELNALWAPIAKVARKARG